MMETIQAWVSNNPWLTILGALGSIASIWGLYLTLRTPRSKQTVIAGGSIRGSAIESAESTDQQIIANKDIVNSPIKQASKPTD